jgi:hypothetical protein
MTTISDWATIEGAGDAQTEVQALFLRPTMIIPDAIETQMIF